MRDKFQPDDQSIVSISRMGPESGGPCQKAADCPNLGDIPLEKRS